MKLSLFLCLMLVITELSAQTNYIHYTPSDGLAQMQITDLFQENKRFLNLTLSD